MTDEELDRDWKPNGRRPQSTLARSFSQELMDIFRIENSVADLDEQVDRRKQEINTRTSELEALEARIREMEQRLQQPGSSQSHGGPTHNDINKRLAEAHAEHRTHATAMDAAGRNIPNSTNLHTSHQRSPVAGLFSQNQKDKPQASILERYSGGKRGSTSRPGTARQSQQAVPGALPPTPTSSDGEGE